MKKKSVFVLLNFLLIAFGFNETGFAEMQSINYRNTASVISAGGGTMNSMGLSSHTTLGQPSPIMDSLDPPMSNSYDLYPGFWYTLSTGLMPCEDLFSFAQAFGTTGSYVNYNVSCDSEPDGDIDGVDLADFLQEYGL